MSNSVHRRRVGAVLSLCAGLALASPAAEAANWRGYTYMPSATHVAVTTLEELAAEVSEKTGGEFTMRISPGGSMPVSATDITQAVADNVVQFAADGFFLGNIPIAGVMRLPMLLTDDADWQAAAEIMRPYVEEALAENGVTLLAEYRYPMQVAWSARELTSLQDISGQKMRVTSPEQGEFVQRMGGVPVTIGAPEVATSLQRGVVDGAFTASAGGAILWREMLTHNYRFGPNYFSSLIIVNTAAFEELTPEQQEALREASVNAAGKIEAAMAEMEQNLTAEFEEGGMVVTEASPEDVATAREAVADYWPGWAAERGPKAEEALARVLEAVGE